MLKTFLHKLPFPSREDPPLKLDGLLATGEGSSENLLIITHPHPEYGGTRDNIVVYTVHQGARNAGWDTLRFNFRGAGGSQGTYTGGEWERADVLGALDAAKEKGYKRIAFAGYSFGAYVVLYALPQMVNEIAGVIAVSLPNVAPGFELRLDKEFEKLDLPCLFVSGKIDAMSKLDTLKKHFPPAPNTLFEIHPEADHFWGQEPWREYLKDLVGRWAKGLVSG